MSPDLVALIRALRAEARITVNQERLLANSVTSDELERLLAEARQVDPV